MEPGVGTKVVSSGLFVVRFNVYVFLALELGSLVVLIFFFFFQMVGSFEVFTLSLTLWLFMAQGL